MACRCNGDTGQPERRAVCRWLALSVLAAGAGVTPRRMCADEGRVVARLVSIPFGSARLIEASSVILVRSATGLAALSSRCTHQNRGLSVSAAGRISCPAHGSVFTHEGRPISGPATRQLTWYAAQVDEDGNIRVDTSRRVAAGSWAPLPEWAAVKK